jgi:hypothetical protein
VKTNPTRPTPTGGSFFLTMNGKKSFVLYTDQKEVFDELTDEDAGKLIKHIFAYVNDENPEQTDKLLKIAFLPIKTQLKRDLVIWDEKKQQRAEAGRMGGLAKASKASNASEILANPSTAKQSLANLAVNVNGNVNVNDNVNVNGNVTNKESAKALFSLDDVLIDFEKEKPLKRPYFDRMSEVHSIETKTIKEHFKKWAIIKEGEPMTIAKAENSFNLYLSNNLKSNFKPPEKKESENIFAKLYQLELEKEKQNSQ